MMIVSRSSDPSPRAQRLLSAMCRLVSMLAGVQDGLADVALLDLHVVHVAVDVRARRGG